jgi:hypothetical protein
MTGLGFTNTVTVNGIPELDALHAPNVGVTRYTAVCVKLVLLVKFPMILFNADDVWPPVNEMSETVGAFQL